MRAFLVACSVAAVALVAGLLVSAGHSAPLRTDQAANNMDFFRAINSFMCSTGSEHCVVMGSGASSVGFPELREKVVRRVLEFTHEMLHPSSLRHLALRASLPRDLRELLQLALKFYVAPRGAGASKLATHKAAAQAVLAAWASVSPKEAATARDNSRRMVGAETYAIFGWIPQFAADAHVGGGAVSFETKCHGAVTVTAAQSTTQSSTVDVTTQVTSSGFLCSDLLLLLAGAEDVRIQILDSGNPLQWSFSTASYTTENTWYLNRHGARVLKFPKGLIDTVGQIIATVNFIAGYFEFPITNATFTANLQFQQDYLEFSPAMQPKAHFRTGGSAVGLDADFVNSINSGDAFMVMRPDGLDEMISWGQGMSAGHSTIAMRNASGHLHVCESTTTDAYWPTNGVQCTPWARWLQQVSAGQMNVMLAPLAPEFRAKFDVNKAWAKFRELEGVNYGFPNFLFGWIDTPTNNFPCLPPDFKTCLQPQATEQLALILDKLMGAANTNIFRQGVNHRCGTSGRTVLGAFYTAATTRSMTWQDIYTAVEQDSWLYNMTLNNGSFTMAQSSVCSVFVCRTWKAAGIFSGINNEINCGEQTPWDIFSMQLFDPAKLGANRPAICQQYDPDNERCVITGVISNNGKPGFNSRPLYAHMGEKCPGLTPDYVRPAGC